MDIGEKDREEAKLCTRARMKEVARYRKKKKKQKRLPAYRRRKRGLTSTARNAIKNLVWSGTHW
jgi:hypothetical protein